MKKNGLLSVAMAITLCFLPTLKFDAQTSMSEVSMTNADIVSMTKAGLDRAVIIGKIRSSKTNFDLSTDALIKLKQDGVADTVVAMMLPAENVIPIAVPEAREITVTIPDGTEVEVQLKNNLSGEEVKIGDIVDLSVVRDVLVNGGVVIAQGSSATARSTAAKKAGH